MYGGKVRIQISYFRNAFVCPTTNKAGCVTSLLRII